MKKFVRILAFVMTFALLGMVFTSCAAQTLSGEYKLELAEDTQGGLGGLLGNIGDAIADATNSSTTLTFSGSKVTYKLTVAGETIVSQEGTYSIKDGKITLDFVNEEAVTNADLREELADVNGTFDFAEDGDKITIGGATYVKQK